MISIDRLQLTLPAGFEHRAAPLTRHVAEALAMLPVGASRRLTRLAVPPVTLDPGAGDRELARTIAEAIHRQLEEDRG